QEIQEAGPIHMASCRNRDDQAVGYVVYTVRNDKVGHVARSQEIEIRDLVWLDIDAYRSLWAFLARHDLVGRIVWRSAAADDPAEEMFAEPRMLHARDTEGVFFRVVDVEQALASRGYDSDEDVIVKIAADRETPWNEGAYRLTVSNGIAQVARTEQAADVALTIKSLSSAFVGYRRVRQLANWGLATGSDAAIARLDKLLATRHRPHCPDHF
ncbi:MAG: enhanced intracellular survival protein Eis, partial [Pseudomonadales bacterium]